MKRIAIPAGLILVGLINLLNGLFMLANPDGWYAAVIGDTAMGAMDTHFIRDVGLAYLASGMGLAWGARSGATAAALALAGATWPMLHALYHLELWARHGVPTGMALYNEGLGVVVLSFAGAALAWAHFRTGEKDAEGTSAPLH